MYISNQTDTKGQNMPNKIKTNDIKKGTRIQLANGWYATMADNKKGNIRMAEVEGLYTDTGSVYSHDIKRALIDGDWVEVEYTKSQLQCKNQVSIFGF